MKKGLSLLLITISVITAHAQNTGNVGIGTTTPDPSALLHLESDSMGLLVPRLSRGHRDSVSDPASGLVIFNTTDSVLQYYNGHCWLFTKQRDCDDCILDIELSAHSGSIPRTYSDTVSVGITVNQLTGSTADIPLIVLSNLPDEVSYTFSAPIIENGSGTTRLIFEASVFAQPGQYPVAIQAMCGSNVKYVSYLLEIDPCLEVDIVSNEIQYNLYNEVSGAISGDPVCVIVNVHRGIEVTSGDATLPAFTEGYSFPFFSHIGINNMGAIIGGGGDGGVLEASSFGLPGEDGGTALEITSRTSYKEDSPGFLFGGGGGGASVGWGFTIPFSDWTSGIFDNLNFGFGAGGGGGAGSGTGGGAADGGSILGAFENGTNGSGGLDGMAGSGGQFNYSYPFNFTIPVVGISIGVEVGVAGNGGDGGEYGVSAGASRIEPVIIGSIMGIPIDFGFLMDNIPDLEEGGQGGYAVKRVGGVSLQGLYDANYQSTFIKGKVGE